MTRTTAAMAAILALMLALPAAGQARSYGASSWGDNVHGQLGNNPPLDGVPTAIGKLNGVEAESGGTYHSLALTGGRVMSWGAGDFGQLGRTEGPNTLPGLVSGLSKVTGISGGGFFSLALLSDGTVRSWGSNEVGQLGIGTREGPDQCAFGITCARTPVTVTGLSGVKEVAAGSDHGLALMSDGTVMAWGDNLFGQLGTGNTSDSDSPVKVFGLTGVKAIAAGSEFSVALLENGHVLTWGYNGDGELGDGNTGKSDLPTEVSGLSAVKAIAVNAVGRHTVALLEDGTVRTWGGNEFGQLGNNSTTNSSVPVEVGGLSGVSAVAAGGRHSMALLTDGTVDAWGSDEGHQLGQGSSTTNIGVPVAVKGVSGVGGIAAGGYHSLSFTAPAALEFGRCVKLAKGASGRYSASKCTGVATESKHGFEWEQGAVLNGFTIDLKPSTTATLETAKGTRILCAGETGSGEYSGLGTLGAIVLDFAGCESQGQACTSSGAGTGHVKSAALDGALGWENMAKHKVALGLSPHTGEVLLEFLCGSTSVVVRGSLLVKAGAGKMAASETLKYTESHGKQKQNHFEGAGPSVLEASLGGGPFEPVGLKASLVRTSEERLELNWFV